MKSHDKQILSWTNFTHEHDPEILSQPLASKRTGSLEPKAHPILEVVAEFQGDLSRPFRICSFE